MSANINFWRTDQPTAGYLTQKVPYRGWPLRGFRTASCSGVRPSGDPVLALWRCRTAFGPLAGPVLCPKSDTSTHDLVGTVPARTWSGQVLCPKLDKSTHDLAGTVPARALMTSGYDHYVIQRSASGLWAEALLAKTAGKRLFLGSLDAVRKPRKGHPLAEAQFRSTNEPTSFSVLFFVRTQVPIPSYI